MENLIHGEASTKRKICVYYLDNGAFNYCIYPSCTGLIINRLKDGIYLFVQLDCGHDMYRMEDVTLISFLE